MIGYAQYGEGQEKVMVTHGWKTDHTCYDSMVPWLDQKAYSYCFVDQRGYGKSINMPGPYTIEQVADDMIELAERLGWESYHIIGHSMGGKVIQRVMSRVPERIKSAIGVTPCPACKLPFDQQGWELFSGADQDTAKRLEIFRISTGNRLSEGWYKKITTKSFKMSKAEAFREYLDSWVNCDLVEQISGCGIPIKVIVGEFDPDLSFDLMTSTYGQWCHNAQIVELGNCGHYPMMETPLSLLAEWENFLGEHK